MGERGRADNLLVQRGIFPSREKAQQAIAQGRVLFGGRPVGKPSSMVDAEAPVRILGETEDYVSRGGKKLEGALDDLGLSVEGMSALDAGAATGGFTDCLLRRGARAVAAVDVGYGQLAWRLRQDPRVRVLERTNVRYLTPERAGGPVDLVVADLSFISLRIILPALAGLVEKGGVLIVLVKPQFEVGKGEVGKGGVVRDPAAHRQVVLEVGRVAEELGLGVRGVTFSRLPGPEGNLEFFLYLRKGEVSADWEPLVEKVVEQAHRELKQH